jgi:hypothetical protein
MLFRAKFKLHGHKCDRYLVSVATATSHQSDVEKDGCLRGCSPVMVEAAGG